MSARTMHAAVIRGPHQVSIEAVRRPEPGRQEVRVRLEGCGICASHLPVWEGRPWFEYPLAPGAPGHEGWGYVDAVGPEVEHLTPGQRVALLSSHALAEYDIAPAEAVVELPAALQHQPCPGEALGCAINIFRRSAIVPSETVAVVGIGFLGALLTGLATRAGARVIAVSRRPCALDMARSYGAIAALRLTEQQQVIERVQALTQGTGCDCVIEATGKQEPLDLASQFTRVRGRLVIAGYHQDGPRMVNMQLWNWRGLDVINAHERDLQVARLGVQRAVDEVASGRLDPTPLYTHAFGLHQLAAALSTVQQRPAAFFKAYITL